MTASRTHAALEEALRRHLDEPTEATRYAAYELGRQALEELQRSHDRLREQAAALEQANAELEEAKREAETAGRAKTDFLASMSHEIRTPMNAIIGMTSVLAESQLTRDQRDWVEILRGSSEHLLVADARALQPDDRWPR